MNAYDGGSLAPFVIPSLVPLTDDRRSPVYYVVISAAVGVVGLLLCGHFNQVGGATKLKLSYPTPNW